MLQAPAGLPIGDNGFIGFGIDAWTGWANMLPGLLPDNAYWSQDNMECIMLKKGLFVVGMSTLVVMGGCAQIPQSGEQALAGAQQLHGLPSNPMPLSPDAQSKIAADNPTEGLVLAVISHPGNKSH